MNNFLEDLGARFKAAKTWLQSPTTSSRMDGIDPNTTRLCGGKTCDCVELELKEAGGLSLETGHVSLESQRTESEKAIQMELDSVHEERDLDTIV